MNSDQEYGCLIFLGFFILVFVLYPIAAAIWPVLR